ncbi:MAG TPA: GNAT family N-acetyltransferase [Anaerolineales bacterium]|nr:GNAT family N-acetyltransferase [Anaerolineales bacterium]
MPHLRIYPARKLPAYLKWQIVAFMRTYAWEVFRRKPIGWDFMQPETHPVSFALMEKRVLLSHALVTWRDLSHTGASYRTYGLSAVFTFPDVRGRGHGHQVVEAATAHILASDADVAMLRCQPELKRFYGAAGWTPMDDLKILYGSKENPTEGDRIMMLFVSAKGPLAQAAFRQDPVYVGDYMW